MISTLSASFIKNRRLFHSFFKQNTGKEHCFARNKLWKVTIHRSNPLNPRNNFDFYRHGLRDGLSAKKTNFSLFFSVKLRILIYVIRTK